LQGGVKGLSLLSRLYELLDFRFKICYIQISLRSCKRYATESLLHTAIVEVSEVRELFLLHTLNVYHNGVFVSLDNRDSHAVLKVVKLLKIKFIIL